ncbi:MAG: LemA family protein [Deltaproteobacteria bacterium]|nr:MAG: LemA family protein [Deltaproteobacteria bacterium]
MLPTLITILGIIGGLALWVMTIFNKLVSLRNKYKNAFAQIEVQLKRRYDLIPNLIETAKGYMKHEKETLEAVVNARNAAQQGLAAASANPEDSEAVANLAGAESALSSSLARFSMVMEAYPDLKASENMMQLNEELTSTENKVSFARQSFNDQVMAYNTYRQSFPALIFANMFGHTKDAGLLEFADSKQIQEAPKVSFT